MPFSKSVATQFLRSLEMQIKSRHEESGKEDSCILEFFNEIYAVKPV